MGKTLLVVEPLSVDSNPFDAVDGGGRLGRPLQKALGQVLLHIGQQTAVVIVSGNPSTGKTLLTKIARRACADMGLSARRILRGDVADVASGDRCDVLLIDEADSLPDSTLRKFLSEAGARWAITTVLLCRPASVGRLTAASHAVVVELTRLSQTDTRHYLLERATQAGFSDLFTPMALESLVDGSRGVPGYLWSIAGLAYFYAASASASQIGRDHITRAMAEIACPEIPEDKGPTTPSIKPVAETLSKRSVAPPVVKQERSSEQGAGFKRSNADEPVASRMSRVGLQQAPVRSVPAVETARIGTILKGLEPIPEAPDDDVKDGDLQRANASHPARSGFAQAHANTDSDRTRRLPALIVPAAGVAAALAATFALTLFFQPTSRNEKPSLATKNVLVAAPAAASGLGTAPAYPAKTVTQGGAKPTAGKKTVALSKPSTSMPSTPPISPAPNTIAPKASQTAITTKPVRILETPAVPDAPAGEAVATTLDNTVNPAPTQADDGPSGNADFAPLEDSGVALADGIVATALLPQPQAERDEISKQPTAQIDTAAVQEAEAKEAARRGAALARAAAEAIAAQKERERQRRVNDFKPHYRLY